jgi:hypothetical protein
MIGAIPNNFPQEGPNGSKYTLANSVFIPVTTADARNTSGILHGISNAFTISIWACRISAPTADARMFVIGPSSGTVNEISIWDINTGDLRQINLYDSAGTLFKSYSYTATNQLPTTTVHHHVFTWDGTNLLYYVDGILETPTLITDNAGTMTNTSRGMTFGGGWAGTEVFAWQPCHAAVWNVAFTALEAASLYCNGWGHQANLAEPFYDYASQNSLVHWWRTTLDNTSATTRGTDYAVGPAARPYNFTTTANSGWTKPAVGSLTHTGEAPGVTFVATTQYLSNQVPFLLGMTNVMSWAVSFRPSTTATQAYLLDIRTTASANNRIEMVCDYADTTNPMTVRITNSSGSTIKDYDWDFISTKTDSIAETPSTSFHFVFTWDGPNNQLIGYRNGRVYPPTVIVTDVNSSARTDTPVSVWLGARFDATLGIGGRMGYIAGWNKILSATEVKTIFNAGYTDLFDLNKNSLGYYGADNLRHNWRGAGRPQSFYGANTGTFTADLVEGGVGVNVEVNKPAGLARIDSDQNTGATFLHQGTNLRFFQGQWAANWTPQLIGIANAWTIHWTHWQAAIADVADYITFSTGTGATANTIRIYNKDTVTRGLQVQLYDSAGVLFKDVIFNAIVVAATHTRLTISWDGTTIKLHKDGVDTAISVTNTSIAGTMTDTARGMCINKGYNSTNGPQATPAADKSCTMNFYGIAVWNKALSTATILELAYHRDLGRINLRRPQTTWYSAADAAALVHWWRFAAEPDDVGRDLIPTYALNLGKDLQGTLKTLGSNTTGFQMQGESQD